MQEVFAKARSMGATDAAIVHWLDSKMAGLGCTPREMIERGKTAIVLQDLDRMGEGVFS